MIRFGTPAAPLPKPAKSGTMTGNQQSLPKPRIDDPSMADERDASRPAGAFDAATALLELKTAAEQKLLSPGAVANIRAWLTEPRYHEYAPLVAEHLEQGRWKELDDVFWTVIPFGTGGRRGKMYPIGSNAINDRTIGESAQGLADYVKETLGRRRPGPARSPTTRGTSRGILPNCVPRSWRRPASKSISSTDFAARPSFRSPCATSTAVAASWSPPATIRPATTR